MFAQVLQHPKEPQIGTARPLEPDLTRPCPFWDTQQQGEARWVQKRSKKGTKREQSPFPRGSRQAAAPQLNICRPPSCPGPRS